MNEKPDENVAVEKDEYIKEIDVGHADVSGGRKVPPVTYPPPPPVPH